MGYLNSLKRLSLVGVAAGLTVAAGSALAWEHAGRMTGGGSIFCPDNGGEIHVTHGFELHCGLSDGTIDGPNNLEINWDTGQNFHLVALTESVCTNEPGIDEGQPSAGFDTMVGTGVGTLNQQAGYTIHFTLTDAGEPGAGVDVAAFEITGPSGSLSCPATVLEQGGNHQAHRGTGRP